MCPVMTSQMETTEMKCIEKLIMSCCESYKQKNVFKMLVLGGGKASRLKLCESRLNLYE